MKISIVIPTFNYDKYIARAIRSCIEQSFPKKDFEIIVVNDSSKDSTKYILASYGYWIRTLENRENRGLPYSRNKGIENAQGEFIVNLDADDYLHADFLKVLFLHMKFNRCDAVASDYYIVDDQEEIVCRMNVHEKSIACGIMFRRNQMDEIGLYDTALRVAEDVDFRMRFEKRFSIERINLPLYRYRLHKHNLTLDTQNNCRYLDMVSSKHGLSAVSNVYPMSELKENLVKT
jgi:glycosyltransferase involved in cell wall biosynthesis